MKNNTFKFWKDIWDKKGNSENEDLLYLNGYEHLDYEFNSQELVSKISSILNIQKNHTILEVGCGTGFLTRHFDCNYIGIDYSKPLAKRNKNYTGRKIFCCEANNLPFPNKYFDKIFSFGVIQYFPDIMYLEQSISEMKRVTKYDILIGDLRCKSPRNTHLLIPKDYFINKGFDIIKCLYDEKSKERYNAYLKIGE